MKNRNRKRKFVVWLENLTDRRDDEWVVVYVRQKKQAFFAAYGQFDMTRFKPSRVLTAAEFRSEMGFGA